MAGYDFSTRKGVDTRLSIMARFGPPLAEETAGLNNLYHILSYPISGQSGNLLLLFHGEELLGVFLESARASLDSTVISHQRAQDNRIVLFQAHFEGKEGVTFMARRDHLINVPKWKPGDGSPPPLSETQAEAIALAWRQRQAPELSGTCRARQIYEVRSFPGISFYQVDLGDFRSPPRLRQVLVLMDGTVVAGESEVGQ